MAAEVYTVDINADSKLAIYGGSNDGATVYNYAEGRIADLITGLDESLVYAKFLPEYVLLVTVSGTVFPVCDREDIGPVEVGESVSVARQCEMLLVGTESGKVFVYDSELACVNTCSGHISSVTHLDYCDGRVYSLSETNFFVHDAYGNVLYAIGGGNVTAFCHISGELYCVARNSRVLVYKGKERLFEMATEDTAEAITMVGKNLVIGGMFDHIVLLDTLRHYASYKLRTGASITEIRRFGEHGVAFATTCDRVGVVDIRDVKTLRLFDSGVGTVFDIACAGDKIIVGGEEGACIFDGEGNVVMEPQDDVYDDGDDDDADYDNDDNDDADCDLSEEHAE
ncbi:hypothetical protein PAPHI01_1819 [Pancytospora philotis]|nr:hypothetical protein PAPHI01_1819 [Pancytospora philotis]